jgi:hypothetical protein
MTPISDADLQSKVSELLEGIYAKRIENLAKLDLMKVLRAKNPYLFRAMGSDDVSVIVQNILNAVISSSDETIFGNDFFEPLALWVAQQATADDPTTSAQVSSAAGADFEIHTDHVISLYSVKSGTSVFNGSSKKKQLEEFRQAQSRLAKMRKQFDPVIAYCYGRKASKAVGYREVADQVFWAEISGEDRFYMRIIEAFVSGQKEREFHFNAEYARVVDKFGNQILNQFADNTGAIDWPALVAFNSSKERPGNRQQ